MGSILEALNRKLKILPAVSGGYLGTDTGLAHRHNGIAEAYNIHALFKHARRKFLSCARIVEHNRHYRVRARQHVKAELAKLAAEEGGVFMHLVAQRGGGGEHLQHLKTCRADGRSQRIAEKIGAAALP